MSKPHYESPQNHGSQSAERHHESSIHSIENRLKHYDLDGASHQLGQLQHHEYRDAFKTDLDRINKDMGNMLKDHKGRDLELFDAGHGQFDLRRKQAKPDTADSAKTRDVPLPPRRPDEFNAAPPAKIGDAAVAAPAAKIGDGTLPAPPAAATDALTIPGAQIKAREAQAIAAAPPDSAAVINSARRDVTPPGVLPPPPDLPATSGKRIESTSAPRAEARPEPRAEARPEPEAPERHPRRHSERSERHVRRHGRRGGGGRRGHRGHRGRRSEGGHRRGAGRERGEDPKDNDDNETPDDVKSGSQDIPNPNDPKGVDAAPKGQPDVAAKDPKDATLPGAPKADATLPKDLQTTYDTIGASPKQHTLQENALAIGAAVTKEVSALGYDAATARRVAEGFVAAGLTETMTDMKHGSLNNTEKGDYHHGRPTSFGFLQAHKGGQLTDDIKDGHNITSPMTPEDAFTPNKAVQRAFHHFMQQHPNLESEKSIANAIRKSQAASDGRYGLKYAEHLAEAKNLLGMTGYYAMLDGSRTSELAQGR